MTFPITINYYKQTIRLSVEQVYIDDRVERYRVTGSNGMIVFQSNRPLFWNKGVKHRIGTWQQTEGKALGSHALELIAKAIVDHVERK
jgi:hypothetical protein